MAQYTAPICEICIGGQAGEHYCRQCEQFFCGNCKSSHLRSKISKNHTFVSGPNINKEEKLLCTEHEESFLFYCHDCETPVCRICSVRKHSRHLMTDLAETTLELKSEVSKIIISKITASQLNISKIEEETKTYRDEVKEVIKTITDDGNYWKQLIDNKIEDLTKEVQDKEQKEIQNMTAFREVYEGVVQNCETCQKDIKKMETTADILLFKKLKQLKPEVDQIALKPIPNAPSVSYRNKKPFSTEIDSLFGELKFRETKANNGQIDNQLSASETKAIIRKIDSQQSASLDGRLMEVRYQYAAAIDIGTTYSGFAFSTRVEQMSIYTCDWRDSDLTSSKTPTSVLLNKQKEFVAFGYEADKKYTDNIILDEEMDDFYYFRRFKTRLIYEKLSLHTEIEEVCGKKMKALDVFCIAIKYLKDQLIRKIQSRIKSASEDEIRFVLTVPSIWPDEAKFFMKAAAEKAGIENDQLILALEPEAASIYCHELRLDYDRRENKFLPLITPGVKFMVIDLGGGTADITVHQRQKDETLEEVISPSGGPWGGTSVDDTFLEFMIDLFGEDVIQRLKNEELEDYIHLLHDFEFKKRSIKAKGVDDKDIVIQIDASLMELIKECRGGISSHIKKTKYRDSVSAVRQKLHIKADIFRNFFYYTIDKLIHHLSNIFAQPELSDLKNIIMVGGFSECDLVQIALRNRFGGNKRIIIPDESGLAVLRGAVLFGHQKKKITKII